MTEDTKQKSATTKIIYPNDVYVNICKFLTFVLRHKPQVAGLKLDEQGFAEIPRVLSSIEKLKKIKLSEQELLTITKKFAKNIFQVQEGKIRAEFGHSIILNMIIPKGFIESKNVPRNLYALIDNRETWSIISGGLKSSNLKSDLVADSNKLILKDGLKIVTVDSSKAEKTSTFYYNESSNSYFCKFVPAGNVKFTI